MPRPRTPRKGSRPTTRAEFVAIATRLRPKDWTRTGFRARAAQIAVALLHRDVPLDALDAWWPGGAENADEGGVGPYARCWAHYGHLAKQTAPTNARAADADVQAAVVDGVTEQPAYVACRDGETRAVYPKSLPVHVALSALDRYYADPAREEHERTRCLQWWAWIVTHPGWLAPFDVQQPVAQWPAPAAPWLLAIHEMDVVALLVAYNRIDREAIVLMFSAFPPRPDQGPNRLSLAGFWGALAKDRDLTTASAKRFVATTLSESVAQDEARQRGEAEAAQKQRAGAR